MRCTERRARLGLLVRSAGAQRGDALGISTSARAATSPRLRQGWGGAVRLVRFFLPVKSSAAKQLRIDDIARSNRGRHHACFAQSIRGSLAAGRPIILRGSDAWGKLRKLKSE